MLLTEVKGEESVEKKCTEYFQALNPEYKSSLMCEWQALRKELEKADQDVFITFRKRGGSVASTTNKTQGLAIIGITETKATILHLSTVSLDDFNEACKILCAYLTNNSRVTEVLINLKHFVDAADPAGPKLKINDEFKNRLKDIGFRWRSLNNYEDGSRYTLFSYKPSEKNQPADEMRLTTGQILVAKLNCTHLMLATDGQINLGGLNKSSVFLSR